MFKGIIFKNFGYKCNPYPGIHPNNIFLEWIDPDDMGMPSPNIGSSRKLSYNEDSSDFVSPDPNIELNSLKNQIKSLNSIIDSLQQENLKLNKSFNLLHAKYINVSSLNNTENKDRKSESGKIENVSSS